MCGYGGWRELCSVCGTVEKEGDWLEWRHCVISMCGSNAEKVRAQLLSQFKGRGDLQTDFLISQEEYEEWIKEPQVKKMVKSLGTEDRDLRAFLFADRQRIQFTELMEAVTCPLAHERLPPFALRKRNLMSSHAAQQL